MSDSRCRWLRAQAEERQPVSRYEARAATQ